MATTGRASALPVVALDAQKKKHCPPEGGATFAEISEQLPFFPDHTDRRLLRSSKETANLVQQAINNVTPLTELRAISPKMGRNRRRKQKVVPVLPAKAAKLAIQ